MFGRLLPISILAGFVVSLAAGIWGYHKGSADAEARCDAERLRAELATVKRNLEVREALDRIGADLAKSADEERARLQQEVSDYEQELAKRPDAVCRITDDDVRRLPGHDAGKPVAR